ncbi:DUF5753 domain-containing protein [Streptomyces bungoensis]|uniref:DUF5753 domain-containing protein n=1 Tax=Streptomyces bungoensis TaxID=285568 RepID=UPI0033E3185B
MLFRESAKTIAARALDTSLYLHLTEQFVHMHGHRPNAAEARSWERSIPALAAALNDAGLGEVEVILEYALPLNSKRADAVLAGVHPTTGEPSYVVVELKQWSQAEPDEDDPALCRIDAYAHPILNPIEQVRRYCEYLVNFNGAVAEHPDRVSGVAYLHNATEFGVGGLRAVELDNRGQMFTGERRGEFIDHLRVRLSDKVPGARAADELQAGRIVPSKQLMSVAAQEVREREQFVLLDEQQVAYRMVLNAVRKAKRSNHKEVVVVTGGPGTGFIDQADEALGAGGVLSASKEEVARAQYPAFFRDAAKLEAEAVELHVYANQAVPGLLQTEEYARAVFINWRPLLHEDVVEQRVTARLARQEIFCRAQLPTLSFVIEESVLRRPLAGWGVMRGQLEQILLHGQRRNVEIQVMPTERDEHAGLAGPFTLIETKEGRRIAYVEAQQDSRLYTARKPVREIEEQYGLLRAQALTPRESLAFVEKLLGER